MNGYVFIDQSSNVLLVDSGGKKNIYNLNILFNQSITSGMQVTDLITKVKGYLPNYLPARLQDNIAQDFTIIELTKYKNILDDPKLLIEYIDSQRLNTMPLFQATETFQVKYLLKPWFEAYLQTYGPPPNGVFESDKLAEIVIKLVSDGIITEDDFINDRVTL
jgi:hypothetical protein